MLRDVSDLLNRQVDAAIAEYLEAVKDGVTPNLESFVSQHSEIAAELREFLADHLALDEVAKDSIRKTSTDGNANSTDRSRSPSRPRFTGPQRFGNFELVEEIARGGMGVVYKARQTTPSRTVALKMILAGQFASQSDVDRFEEEAHAAAGLDHPHIVPIHEVGEWEGQHYFTMAFVEGESLAQRLARGPLPSSASAEMLREVAMAVEYAHQRGVIHRDLKPANLLLETDGRVRVTDFGLAKRQAEESGLTRTGELLGTPSFMSPEQVSGDPTTIGTAADVYSLGATLYALITGRPPFQAASTVDTLRQVLEKEPVSPRELDATIPRDLETITLKCLEKDAAKRYRNAGDLADDLERFLADRPILARRSTRAERAVRWCRRNPSIASLSGTVAALLLAAVTILAVGNARIRMQAARSDQVAQFLTETLRAAGPSVARGRDATLLREILDKTAERVEKELKDQPEVQGDLWFTLGSAYEDISDDPRGMGMFQHAADSYRVALGDSNPKRARALARFGSMQGMTGDALAGKKTTQLAVDTARSCGDPAVLAECLYHRALASRVWGATGRTGAEDLPLLRESVSLYRQSNNDPLGLIRSLSRLSYSIPDTKEAEALSREALALGRQHLPPDHPDIAELLSNLGGILLDGGKLEEAEQTLRASVELHVKLHALPNAWHKTPRRRLVEALARRGKWDEAESLVRESIEASTPNKDSHRLYCSLLVRLLASRGRSKEALEESARLLSINPDAADQKVLQCNILLQTGQKEAFLELCHALLQKDDPPYEESVAKLACVLPVDGVDLERACKLANFSVNSMDLELYEGVDMARPITQALAEYRQGRYESASQWANRAIEKNADGPFWVQAKMIQAMALARLRKMESARKDLTEGDELLREPHVDYLLHYPPRSFGEWTIAELLRREAVAGLAGTATQSLTDINPTDCPTTRSNLSPTIDSEWYVSSGEQSTIDESAAMSDR